MRTAIFFLILATAAPAAAQTRAAEFAAAFSKTKNVSTAKKGVIKKKYREITSSVWQVENGREYAGRYVSLGDPMTLEVQIGRAGTVAARGSDPKPFRIENARIDAALLTGTKAYRDGRREPFEGAFLKRSDRASPDQPFTTLYGIGVLLAAPAGTGIGTDLHVFLRRQ